MKVAVAEIYQAVAQKKRLTTHALRAVALAKWLYVIGAITVMEKGGGGKRKKERLVLGRTVVPSTKM